jgi:hypothetical protein
MAESWAAVAFRKPAADALTSTFGTTALCGSNDGLLPARERNGGNIITVTSETSSRNARIFA